MEKSKIMAVEAKKVLDNLSTKTKGKSVSKTYLKTVSDKWAAKIEADADIDDYVNERLDDIVEAGAEADRRVNQALKKAETTKTNGGDGKTPTTPEIDDDELKDAPAYVKAMMKQMQALNTEITGLKTEKSQQSLTERFLKHEKLKGIDPKLLKGRVPTKEEDFDITLEEVYEDLKDYAKSDDGKGGQSSNRVGDRPGFSGGKPATSGSTTQTKQDVPDAIKAFTTQFNKTANSQNSSVTQKQ